jgi:hypothetical protein
MVSPYLQTQWEPYLAKTYPWNLARGGRSTLRYQCNSFVFELFWILLVATFL